MTWKDIAAFVDGSDDGVARLRMALSLVSENEGSVQAHVISLTPMPPYGIGASAMADTYAEAVTAARTAGGEVAAKLRTATADAGDRITVRQHEMTSGDVRSQAAVLAREADLAVLGQPEEGDRSSLDTDLFVGVLMGGGRPVLMLPRWRQPHAWGKRALIAWKGAPESARAVHEALPLLKRAETVRILAASPRGEIHGEGEQGLQRLAAHLKRHGVKVQDHLLRQADGEPERAVLSEVEAYGADLLVMGGYGRSRMSEIVWGGVTASVIRNVRVPVLMSH